MPKPASTSPASPTVKPVRFLLIGITLLVSLLACNLPGSNQNPAETSVSLPESQALYDELGVSLEEAMAVEAEDQRAGVIEQMGPPDSFTLRWHELEGQPVRWEEWSYYDFQSRFDFIDGELLWTLDLDSAPNGSFYAHAFDPLQFEYGQDRQQVIAMLPELDWQPIPLDEADIEAGELLAADQILLGFDQDQLVFVQTFILVPESPFESPELEPLATSSPAPAQQATATIQIQTDSSLINDDFDDPNHTAVPLFGEQYMEFNVGGGVGELLAKDTGVLPTMYHDGLVADFALSTQFLITHSDPGTLLGLVFRSEDPSDGMEHYYFLYLDPEQSTIYLDRFQNGSFENIDQASYAVAIESTLDPIDLELAAQGSRFDVWLNGIQFLSAVDPNPLLQAGNLGMAIASDQASGAVQFEYLQVDPLSE